MRVNLDGFASQPDIRVLDRRWVDAAGTGEALVATGQP